MREEAGSLKIAIREFGPAYLGIAMMSGQPILFRAKVVRGEFKLRGENVDHDGYPLVHFFLDSFSYRHLEGAKLQGYFCDHRGRTEGNPVRFGGTYDFTIGDGELVKMV